MPHECMTLPFHIALLTGPALHPLPSLPAGVLHSSSPSITFLLIPDGAHHVDLMYSHEGDTEAIRQARQLELQHMRAWVAGYWARREGAMAGQEGAKGRPAVAASS